MSQVFEKIMNNVGELNVHPTINVTPELASELLTLNDNNRPLRSSVVKMYANEMKAGNWRFNGDLIRISKTGRLLDAQHRLMGVVESGVPQLFNIQTGLEEDAFNTIDMGKNRTSADLISIRHIPNAHVVAGAVRLIMYYDNDAMKVNEDNLNTEFRYRPYAVVKWFEENGEEPLLTYVHMANNLYNKAKFLLTPKILSGFLYLFSRADGDSTRPQEFFERLVSGNCTPEEHAPIYLLREKLIVWRTKYGSLIGSNERYANIIKAWNFWKNGQDIKRLRWSASEGFPVIE